MAPHVNNVIVKDGSTRQTFHCTALSSIGIQKPILIFHIEEFEVWADL